MYFANHRPVHYEYTTTKLKCCKISLLIVFFYDRKIIPPKNCNSVLTITVTNIKYLNIIKNLDGVQKSKKINLNRKVM